MHLKIQFEEYQLDNGLRVILHENHGIPIVAVNLWYRVGSKYESPGKTGYAHLFEHMMFQGSEHIAADMHFQLIQGAGGTLNGSTFFDRTNYFETLPSHYLEMGLWLESDRMGYLLPALTQQKFNTQLDVVKNERLQRVDNQPYGLWFEKIMELAYDKTFPYHWPIIGYMDDLDRASLDDIRQFFTTYYAPNNATLVIAGDFEADRTKNLVERYFGPVEPTANIPKFTQRFDGYFSGEKRLVLKDRVQLPRIYLAYHVPATGKKDSYVVDIIADLFSDGKSSRLFQSLIYQKQIAQDAHAFLLPMQETSLLIFMATPKPGIAIEKLEKELQEQIDTLVKNPLEKDELERVKNQVESRKIRELQSVSSRADSLNMFASYFDNPDLINHETEFYKNITEKDVKRVAEKYLRTDNRVGVIFEPE